MTAAAAKADIGHNSEAVGEMIAKDPTLLFREKEMLPMLLESIEKDISAHKPDLSTEKGRKAIASLAFDIAKQKNAIDKAGKALNVDLRKQIDVTDKVRREAWDALEKLQEKARAPLDGWEKQEGDRKALINETRALLHAALNPPLSVTRAQAAAMKSDIEHLLLTEATFQDLMATVDQERAAAIASLDATIARIDRDEADRLELERLRAEKEETERKAREAAAKAAAEKAEAERIAAVEKAAAERAAAEERRKADEARKAEEAERMKVQREREAEEAKKEAARQAELEAERHKAREAEEARLAVERKAEAERKERERQAAAEKARKEAEAAAEAERQRNQEHRSKIMKAAKEAIMEHGKVQEDAAKAIVLAIVGGSVPNVSLRF